MTREDTGTFLVVDLDDTLILTDSFVEQALALAKTAPVDFLKLLTHAGGGRAVLKSKVADAVPLDASGLPYNKDLIDFLTAEKARGRKIILATAADERYAQSVADHLGLFDIVLASNAEQNLKGSAKADAIQEATSGAKFEYVGDCKADREIWARAGSAMVVSKDAAAAAEVAGNLEVTQVFHRDAMDWRVFLKAMRVHQWAKNVLVFVPLLLSHTYDEPDRLFATCLAFLCIGLCASATYFWNDLFDLADDRTHPTKRNRPLASGRMLVKDGVIYSFALLAVSLGLALFLGSFALVCSLLAYVVLTLSYSLVVKRKMVADVILLAMLFLLRILIGGIAANVAVSDWLFAFSIFFFLSLGFAKRLADLPPEVRSSDFLIAGRGYRGTDAPILATLGASSGLSSVIVLALYINEPTVVGLYQNPIVLWGICLILLYWLNRIWLLVHRGELPHDPVVFALKDNISRMLGVMIMVLVLLARYGPASWSVGGELVQ